MSHSSLLYVIRSNSSSRVHGYLNEPEHSVDKEANGADLCIQMRIERLYNNQTKHNANKDTEQSIRQILLQV